MYSVIEMVDIFQMKMTEKLKLISLHCLSFFIIIFASIIPLKAKKKEMKIRAKYI